MVVVNSCSTLLPILLLLLLEGGGHRGRYAVAIEAAHWPKVRVVRVRVRMRVVLTRNARHAEGAKGSGAEGSGGEAQLLDFRFLQALLLVCRRELKRVRVRLRVRTRGGEARKEVRLSGQLSDQQTVERLCTYLFFSTSILKPDLHLRLRQRERVAELGPFGNGEVLLGAKLALQRQQLLRGEGRPRLAVALVLPQGALHRQTGRVARFC